MADIRAVKGGTVYFIERKRDGGYQWAEQKDCQRCATAAGAQYAVVRSIDDVQARTVKRLCDEVSPAFEPCVRQHPEIGEAF